MRRDKKAAQKKKTRTIRKAPPQKSDATLLKMARKSAFGPAFMSVSWRDDSLPPGPVTVVITKQLPKGQLAIQSLLVDRTCLGVKTALSFVIDGDQLDTFIDQLSVVHPGGLEEVDVDVAQSVVVHALAYARRLGFEPDADLDLDLLEPFPAVLVTTPLADAKRPIYMPSRGDDTDAVIAQLSRACGPSGFDVGEATDPGDFDDDGSEHDAPEDPRNDEPAPDEALLHDALEAWLTTIEDDDRFDVVSALGAYIQGATGQNPAEAGELDEALMGLLPLFWAGLFRPLPTGETGIDLARASKPMTPYRDELEQLSRTRAALFDSIEVDLERGLVIGRDVFDGTRLAVRLAAGYLSHIAAGSRFFGYLTPMADGTWYPPSSMLGHAWLGKIAPSEVIRRINDVLAELDIQERIDEARPAEGMKRFGAIVHGVLHRSITELVPTDD